MRECLIHSWGSLAIRIVGSVPEVGLRSPRTPSPTDISKDEIHGIPELGQSGMYVSEIAYGNWMTHVSQIERDAAVECVRAALEVASLASIPRTPVCFVSRHLTNDPSVSTACSSQ